MNFNLRRSQHWAAGSYVDLILAAVIMQILFMLTAIWVGTIGSEFYSNNLVETQYALRLQLSLGWMMCIIAGLGFSILPLIYDIKSFEKTLMRLYVGMNIIGQITIMLGIMSNNLEIFQTLVTIGITLLCTSLVCLGPPAVKVFKSKNTEDGKLGPFSYTLGAITPILGLFIISSWVLRNEIPGILDTSENFIFGFFIPLVIVTLIISHFNRRLDWEIIHANNLSKIFVAYALLLFISFISEPIMNRGDISIRLAAILQLLPYIFIFLMLNPKKIIFMLKEKRQCNKMILASILWLPVIGIAAYAETMGYIETTDAMMSYHRWILIFGVAFQALWGYASYLHDDHKRLSIHRRKTQWFMIFLINIGTIITVYAMSISWQTGEAVQQYPRLGIAIYAISYLFILIHWVKETFLSLDTWHKTPMFYDKYLANPDEGPGALTDN